MFKSIVTVTIVIAAVVSQISGRSTRRYSDERTTSSRPPYVECQSSLECMPGHCCTISPNKFSVPQCNPMQEEGAMCRPTGHATLNTTLVYPDGSQVQLTDVHYVLCPCIYGLTCDHEDGICRDPSQKRGFNHLLGETSTQDD